MAKDEGVADNDDVDSTEGSDAASADRPSGDDAARPAAGGGAHALSAADFNALDHEPVDPADQDAVELLDSRDHDALEPAELTDDPEDKQLVAVGTGGREQQADAGADVGAVARRDKREKKVKATAKQKQVADQERRTGPFTFLRESISELQKVVYPTGQQLVNYFVVVLIFVLFIIAIVSVLDFAFGKAILAVFS